MLLHNSRKAKCNRCQEPCKGPSSFLLTCSECKRSFHHRCHVPPVSDSELVERIKATTAHDVDNGLDRWVCRRCVKGKGKAQPIPEPKVTSISPLPPALQKPGVGPIQRVFTQDADVIILPDDVSLVPEPKSKLSSSRDAPRHTADAHPKRKRLELDETCRTKTASSSTAQAVYSISGSSAATHYTETVCARDQALHPKGPLSVHTIRPGQIPSVDSNNTRADVGRVNTGRSDAIVHSKPGPSGNNRESFGRSSVILQDSSEQSSTTRNTSTLHQSRVSLDGRPAPIERLFSRTTSAGCVAQPNTALPTVPKTSADPVSTSHGDPPRALISNIFPPEPTNPRPCLSIDLTEERRKAKAKGLDTNSNANVLWTDDGPLCLMTKASYDHPPTGAKGGLSDSSSAKPSLPSPMSAEPVISPEGSLPTPTSLATPSVRQVSLENRDSMDTDLQSVPSNLQSYKPEAFNMLDRQNPSLREFWTRVLKRTRTKGESASRRKFPAKKLTKEVKKRVQEVAFISADEWARKKKSISVCVT